MRLCIKSLLAALTLALPLGAAEPEDTSEKLEKAFQDWMQKFGIESGALAISYKGEVVRRVGVGRDADDPVELASVSKSITAMCALSLIEDGTWTASTTVVDVMGDGPQVTVGQLMTHSSGYDTDITQGAMSDMLDTPEHVGTTRDSFAAGPQGQAGTYVYTNENYDMLGALIAAQTGAPYDEACAARVLAPLGITAQPSVRTGAFAAYGGWAMSVADYATFHVAHFGPDTPVGRAPAEFPNAEIGGGARYGPGMVWREFRSGHNFWHFGALCLPEQLNVGSFAVQWNGGWAVTAAYDACLEWPAMSALDGALANAVFGGQ